MVPQEQLQTKWSEFGVAQGGTQNSLVLFSFPNKHAYTQHKYKRNKYDKISVYKAGSLFDVISFLPWADEKC